MPTQITVRLLFVVALSGCSITDFEIDQPIAEQRVEGSPLPGPLAQLFPLPLSIDISSKIKEMETGPIDSVTLTSLQLTITANGQPSGDTDDWRFVEEIHVFVESSMQGSSLPRVEIANVRSPGAVTMLKFNVMSDVDLNPYINEGSTVEAESQGTAPPDDVTFDGKAVFTVHPL